ncbi:MULTISPECIES: DUF2971 domain-containing protein [Paraburkholderia]|uniref:DUF2971 domain-containing protein n=1 Tax=Paraburkholderia TaxID=1822464 RepID=UPI000372749F|nr:MULTISPECIES: DUF2971 domain-containing protein [Paraburkholderia]MDH6147388.1 hypothetical protein [Paraburkholderia sp. WSM4179]
MLPDHLYKYMAIRSQSERRQQQIDRIFTENVLWFAAPASFNDPMDCNPSFTFLGGTESERFCFRRDMLAQLCNEENSNVHPLDQLDLHAEYHKKYPEFNEAFLEVARKLIIDDFQKRTGVLCLSECERDPVMFYHYGDGHRGMCLQFRTDGHFFDKARQVEYSGEYPVIDYLSVPKGDSSTWERLYLTKYSGWSYEHEWRIITPRHQRGLMPYPESLFEGVIFGYLTSDADKEYVIRLLEKRRRPTPSSVKVYQAQLSRSHYLLDIIPCGQVNYFKNFAWYEPFSGAALSGAA